MISHPLSDTPQESAARVLTELRDRFVARFKERMVSVESGCMEWTGERDRCGYGRMRFGNNQYKAAHRLAYQFFVGPIPEGMLVCHRCDNPPCCNPAHLFLGTAKDNSQDMLRKGREYRGRHNAKLSEEQAQEIRSRYRPRESGQANRAALATEYGISVAQVRRIALGLNWTA